MLKFTSMKIQLPTINTPSPDKTQYNWWKLKNLYWVIVLLIIIGNRSSNSVFNLFVLPYNNSFLNSKAPIDSHVVIIPLTKLKSTHDSLTRFPVPIYNDKSQLQEFFLNFHLLRMYKFESSIKWAFFHSSFQVKYNEKRWKINS